MFQALVFIINIYAHAHVQRFAPYNYSYGIILLK